MPSDLEKEIRDLARDLWQKAGCPAGADLGFWLEAEQTILGRQTWLARWRYWSGQWLTGKAAKSCLNFAILVASGGAVAWWVYRCTDWAETTLGLFSLGAFVSFGAVVLSLLPKEQVEAMQKEVVGPFLQNSYFIAATPLALFLLFIVSTFTGSLEIEGGKGGSDVRVSAYAPDADPKAAASAALSANGRVRFPRWTTWKGRDYRIKVSGLPEKKVTVDSWLGACGPQRFLAPADFLRPVLLIGAGSSLIHMPTEANPLKLQLEVTDKAGKAVDKKPYHAAYDGRAVWVGCDAGDVDLPKNLADPKLWGKELGVSATAHKLLPATALKGLPEEFAPGDVVTVFLIDPATPDKKICEPETLTLRQPTNPEEIVQVVSLKYFHVK